MSAPLSWPARIGLVLLFAFLAILGFGAATVERSPDEALRPGEGTTWAQASSLAHDFDLAYTRADYDRLVLTHGTVPADLELVSGSGGKRIGFDRPFPLALWNAPFVAFSPRKGIYFANVALLVLGALALLLTLRRRLGSQAGLWALALVGGTLIFAQVLRAEVDVTLAMLAVLIGCLAISSHPAPRDLPTEVYAVPEARAMGTRWAIAGALMAILVFAEPVHAVLFLGLWWAVPSAESGAARRGLLVGALVGGLAIMLVELWVSGGLPLVGSSRFRFTASTGFPAVDFVAQDWDGALRRLQALHWEGAPRWDWGLDPRLFGWNLLYFFAGRDVGLLVTAPAALLLVAGFAGIRRPGRLGLLVAAALWVTALLLARPFNFHGDPESLGNQLALVPLALLWPIVATRVRGWTVAAVAGVVAVVLLPSWLAALGTAAPGTKGADLGLRERLPAEVTQRWIGEPTSFLGGHHARILSGSGWIEGRRDRLILAGDRLELMIGGGESVEHLLLTAGEAAPLDLGIQGADVGATVLRPDGGYELDLRPRIRNRIHPMWWSPEPQRIAVLRFDLGTAPDEPLALRLVPGGAREEAR